ncbi:cellulose binding domain-containing protein [Micromonospora sp. NPDC050397]|uniref:cellulose binding domain-containing protein n=1 Tax=Micromonospora sp. NPDC050397 TaxID=3364279 RepID=UPI00384E3DD6
MNPDEQTGDLRLGSPDRPPEDDDRPSGNDDQASQAEPPQPVRNNPPRTLAVRILDTVLDSATAVRNLFAPAASRSAGNRPDGRHPDRSPRVGWPVGVGFVAGAAAVLGALVLLLALVLRTPERETPLQVAPPAEQGIDGSPAPGTPGNGASPPAVRTGQPGAEAAPPAVPPAGTGTTRGPGTSPGAPPPAPPTVPLTASYTVEEPSLLGYRATVTIDNPNRAPVDRWTVSITLPRAGMTVRDVVGAQSTQEGTTWTFVPATDTAPAPAGGSVSFRFRVDGVGVNSAPTACTINTHPCTTP